MTFMGRLLFTAAWVAVAQLAGAPVLAQDAALDSLAGWWVAQDSLGSAVRGELTVDGRSGGLHASIAGIQVRAERRGAEVSFALPDGKGAFRGHFVGGGRSLEGHWIQPPSRLSGIAYASPVTLRRVAREAWVGSVDPREDRLSVYLRLRRQEDGTLCGEMFNPEYNIGFRLSLQLSGNASQVHAKDLGRGELRSPSGTTGRATCSRSSGRKSTGRYA
jgi:hypothetical protein